MSAPDPIEPLFERLRQPFTGVWDGVKLVIREAYEAGRIAGRNEAAVELREKMAKLLEVPVAHAGSPATQTPAVEPPTESGRAPRGSVRPAVIQALRDNPGLRPSEVAVIAGINENSARGMLNKLAEEKVTIKMGDRWVLAAVQPSPPPPK